MKKGSKILTILIALLAVLITVQAALAEDLSFSAVTLNGVTLDLNGLSPELKPLQSLRLEFTITNNYTLPVTIYSTQLFILPSGQPEVVFSNENPINLLTGQSKAQTLNAEVPLEFTTGNYPAILRISSLSDDNSQKIIDFPFTLKIKQLAQDVLIQSQASQNIACANSLNVNVDVINLGSVSQLSNTRGITLTLENAKIKTSKNFELNSNTKNGISLSVPVENLTSGVNELTLKASYWFDQYLTSIPIRITKNSCLQSYTPNSNSVSLNQEQSQMFSVNTAENINLRWYVNEVLQSNQANTFTFSASNLGTYNLKVAAGSHPDDSHSWQIMVSNVHFSGNFQTNVPANATLQELANFPNFQVENSNGKIMFNQPVDLRNINNLDSLFTINGNVVSVNSQAASTFNKPATITLKQVFTNYTILKSESFNGNNFVSCPTTTCQVVSNNNGQFVFNVNGFSTYKVVEIVPAQLEVSAINFDQVSRNTELSMSIIIKNLGTSESLTGLRAELIGVSSIYNPQISSIPTILAPGESVTLTLKITLPDDESAGIHSIGTLRVSSNQDTESVNINVNPKSYLAITKLEVNGKTSGDLNPEGENTIDVKVKNEYTEDIESITVTARLLDVDGDDLEEESDSFDLNNGDDDTITLTFDLSGEKLDEDSYTLEITVEGEAADNSNQITVLTKNVNVDREKHRIIFRSIDLGSSILECLRQTNLRTEIENVGKSNEDNVEIHISNTQLGIDQKKSNIELDKYSGNDVNYETSFSLDLEKASAGSYLLKIEVYRDGDLEDSNEVTLEVKECSLTKSQNTNTLSNEELTKQLEEQVKQKVQAQKNAVGTTTSIKTTSFRESQAYMNLLLIFVMLLVLAIIMGIVVAVKKKH